MLRILSLLVPLTLLVAGCGDDDSTSATGGSDGGGDAHGGGHDENTEAEADARAIAVKATSFEFDPATIDAKPGEALEITLTAEDAEHDFVIDELDAHIGADAGETASGGFVAGEAGTYTYYCSVAGHREAGMEGELVVE